MTQEYWKPVVGYEDLYEVSNKGQVRSFDRVDRCGKTRKGRLLSKAITPDGLYWSFCLSRDAKKRTYRAHELVANAFLGPKPKGLEILHGDKGSRDNTVENLRYGTHLQNMRDKYEDGTVPYGTKHSNAKLTEEKVLEAKRRWADGEQQVVMAREFGVTPRTLNRAIHGVTWAHLRAPKCHSHLLS